MDRKRIVENIVAPLVGLAAFIGIWYAAAAWIGVSIILPSPTETLSSFFRLLGSSVFYVAVGHTLLRTILSFLVAFFLACVFAFLSKISAFFRNAFSPIAIIMRVLPTISVILLVLIWFKSATAPFVITFIVIFPMLYTTVLNASDGVDKNLVEMGRVYGFSRLKLFSRIYVPQMTPAVLTGVGITLSFSVKLTVAAEVLSSTKESMGRYMQSASAYIETANLLAWTIAAILLGFLLETAVLLIKKKTTGWYYGK